MLLHGDDLTSAVGPPWTILPADVALVPRAYGPLVAGAAITLGLAGRGPASGAGTALPAAVPLPLRRPYARRMGLRLDVALHTAFRRLLERCAAPVDEPDAEERELLPR